MLQLGTFIILATGAILISPVGFLALSGIFIMSFFLQSAAVVFSALFTEIFLGLIPGIISIPLALAAIGMELLRTRLNEGSLVAFFLLYFTGASIFTVLHMFLVSFI
ncbi:MAG: hypothetical protein AAB930_02685 [Patescibacteria group bacterium]